MAIYCCVPGCKSKSNLNRNVSWHLFPADKKLKEEWVRRINRRTSDGSLWYPKYFHKICGKHFNITGKKQLYNIYPIYFSEDNNDNDSRKEINMYEDLELGCSVTINETLKFALELPSPIFEPENNSLNEIKSIDQVYIKTEHLDLPENNIFDEIEIIEHFYTKSEPLKQPDNDISNEIETECTDHSYAKQDFVSEIETLREQLQKQNKEIETKNKIIETYSTEIKRLELKYKHLERRKARKIIHRMKENESLLLFYTGFENITQYETFLNYIQPKYDSARKLTYKNSESSIANSTIKFEQQLILVLMRLRLRLLEQDLADRFDISISTVSRVWAFWIKFLSSVEGFIPFVSELYSSRVRDKELKLWDLGLHQSKIWRSCTCRLRN